jgi:hypothetical protein
MLIISKKRLLPWRTSLAIDYIMFQNPPLNLHIIYITGF